METDKILELLMELSKDIAVVKSKLESLEEMKLDTKELNNKIEKLEMQNERHEKCIKSLENRQSTMEQFTRNQMIDSKKQQTSIFISMGLAIFSSVLSFIFAMFK